ncbi:MAG: hypothetical protein JWR80_10043 [Bradyrhizobium sp.]|nr:hypothetical protein [Bradyrhizobium sp.]
MSNVTEIHKLRRIEPIPKIEGMSRASDLGQRPELRWVDPTSLLVDEGYQRDLGKRSYSLIRGMMQGFAWRKMKPPIVVEVGDGLHCVDGQHTAIAAASIGVPEIPVFVVGAASLGERADSFVAHNKDRIVMQPLDIYRARIAAGDPDAVDCANVCQRAGVRIRQIQPGGKILVGDTGAVGTIQRLVRRRGVQTSRNILQAFVTGGRGPITPAEIDAAEALMVVVRPDTTMEQFARVVRAIGDRGVIESKMKAMTESRPQKHVLLEVYKAMLDRQAGAQAERARA